MEALQAKPALPFVVRWGDPFDPLPICEVRGPARAKTVDALAPPWLDTGDLRRPFDFCAHVRQLCDDVTLRSPELTHVLTNQILFATTQARNGRPYGLQARVTPLRFQGGRLTRRYRRVNYQIQRHFVADREMLYLMTFCLPRFLNRPFEDKFVTLFHELYHISPTFDGDLRRHEGRCMLHSKSRRGYDERMAVLARAYLADNPPPELHAFLRLDFGQLVARHGAVIGVCVPRPKLVPISDEAATCPGS